MQSPELTCSTTVRSALQTSLCAVPAFPLLEFCSPGMVLLLNAPGGLCREESRMKGLIGERISPSSQCIRDLFAKAIAYHWKLHQSFNSELFDHCELFAKAVACHWCLYQRFSSALFDHQYLGLLKATLELQIWLEQIKAEVGKLKETSYLDWNGFAMARPAFNLHFTS